MSNASNILEGTNLTIIIPEKLDITNSQEILTEALKIVKNTELTCIEFNMKECDFISSAGIGILANITREAKTKNIKTKLTNFSDSIKQILTVTDILRYIGDE